MPIDTSGLNYAADSIIMAIDWFNAERERAGRCPCCGRLPAEGPHDYEQPCGRLLTAFDGLLQFIAAAVRYRTE